MRTNTESSTTRLELLLFRLNNKQHFGINVLKIKEIISRPPLTQIPHSSATVVGVAELRGHSIPVIDLAMAIGRQQIYTDKDEQQKVIIAEFSRSAQGFLVSGVDRIVVREWKDVLPPPGGTNNGYITGVIRMEEELVQLIDVEQVMHQTIETDLDIHDINIDQILHNHLRGRTILVVDDSKVARNLTSRILDRLNINHLTACDGKEALDKIESLTREYDKATDFLPIIISDIEMPKMDGYQLTREIRANPRLHDIYVLLHTSLDGKVNEKHPASVGADEILTKFEPELLTEAIAKGLKNIAI